MRQSNDMATTSGRRPPTEAPARPRLGRTSTTLAAVAIVQLLVSLDLSIVNVALPDIASGLGFEGAELGWVVHAYALTFGGLLLLGGKAADMVGRRRVLIAGLALFALASLLAGLALAPSHLVAARALQGVGAAALQPASLAVLSTTFPEGRERARAFGVWSAVNALGGALGVVLGGVITEYAGWRWVMLLNVPVALLALALTRLGVVTDGPRRRTGRPDIAGGLLATGGMSLLVFTVVRTTEIGWGAPSTIAGLAGAAALLGCFVAVERSSRREPLLRLGLLRNPSVAGSNIFNLLIGAALASCFYFTSLYLQVVLGHAPAPTGIMFLPFALGVILGGVLTITLDGRYSRRTFMIAGAVVAAAGFAWLSTMSATGTFVTDVLGPSLLVSIGFGLCLGPLVSTATIGVARDEAGMASGLLAASRQLGAALGLAVLTTIAQRHVAAESGLGALAAGYGRAMAAGCALVLAAALTAIVVLPGARRHGAGRSTDDATREGG